VTSARSFSIHPYLQTSFGILVDTTYDGSELMSFSAEAMLTTTKVPWRLLLSVLFLLVLPGCGGTWVDDEGNFNRIFGFKQPPDVLVLHSYYWKSPHWSTEFSYFIALQGSPRFISGLTTAEFMTSVAADQTLLKSCGTKQPQWFLPSPLANYQAWVPKAVTGYRVFRDKADGSLFLCDERL
jgi:hypothetical protein